MIPSDIVLRVFHIRCGSYQGTGFSLDHDRRQYLVTAQHLVEEFETVGCLQIFHDTEWKRLNVTLVGENVGADVAVFAAEQLLSAVDLKARPTSADLIYGQEAFFLGFPFGWKGHAPDVMNGFPLPFVKRATVSMFDFANVDGWMFLDGLNNEGFSGGPVGYRVGNTQEWRIGGVIAAYHSTHDFIEVKEEKTELSYYSNSGLIYATPIKRVIELIDANPIGFAHPS